MSTYLAVLNNQAIDDLDGGIDSSQDYRSLLHGEQPIIRRFPSLSQEKKYISETIENLRADGVKLQTICLVARRNNQLIEDYIPGLLSANIDYLLLNANTSDDAGEGVRLATMHRVKGLEFHHVIIAGVNAGLIPWESSHKLDEVDQHDSELQERCLFHMACTRARDTLTITSYGLPSSFITSAGIGSMK